MSSRLSVSGEERVFPQAAPSYGQDETKHLVHRGETRQKSAASAALSRYGLEWMLLGPRRRRLVFVKQQSQILGLVLAMGFSGFAAAPNAKICASCHPKVWNGYRRTGMGQSFSLPSPANTAEHAPYYHRPSATYFTMIQRGGEYFQRGYQLDASGKQSNVTEKRVDYVMGSGNHARTYLHRTSANRLIELPLGWYAERGGYWAMNPGYDRPDHDGFRRPITYDCMFCHNAYPKIPVGHEKPFAEPVYAGPLPEGIDCQRCHGPGERHVQLASSGVKREQIRAAIVNPARLSAERQMEACMVCHLESTSFPLPNAIQRFERDAFSYRPGEPLGNFILNFDHAPGTGREDKFEIVNAAYRLRRAACFLKSSGKLLCTTCHNPHDIPRGAEAQTHYTAVCRQCHAQITAANHTAANECVTCHMPKRRTEDVIHVTVTDHFIQRQRPVGDLLAERAERQDVYRGPVSPHYPDVLPHTAENDLTLAVAQVIQQCNLAEGITQLEAAIEKYKPQRAEYYLELADALQNNGEPVKALPWYREAVRHNPTFGFGLQKLGTALRRSARYEEAQTVLTRATVVEPDRALSWHELGLTYQSAGRSRDAVAAMEKSLTLDPDLPEAHNNLGNILLARGDQERAKAEFQEAIRSKPAYADAHFNYAVTLGQTAHFDEAQHELEEALRADPRFADAHVLLGDLLMAKQQTREAAPHYLEALKIVPESGQAHFGLGAALLATGDREGAVLHLKKAAAGTDAAARDKALDLLRGLKLVDFK